MFRKNKYKIIKKALHDEAVELAFNYLLIKRQVHDTLKDSRYISEFNVDYGSRTTDKQVKGGAYCGYGDILMDSLLLKLKPRLEKETKLKLNETYTYFRIYEKRNVLEYHKDRESCEISATLNLGGDPWAIYLEQPKTKKKIKVDLNPGDLVIYKGAELYHWREPFDGDLCAQVFLHYNDAKSKQYEYLKFDKRKHIGLPLYTRS